MRGATKASSPRSLLDRVDPALDERLRARRCQGLVRALGGRTVLAAATLAGVHDDMVETLRRGVDGLVATCEVRIDHGLRCRAARRLLVDLHAEDDLVGAEVFAEAVRHRE